GAVRDAPHPADLGGPPRRPEPGASTRDQRHPAQAPPTTRADGNHPKGHGPPRGPGRVSRQPARGAAADPGRPGGRTAAHPAGSLAAEDAGLIRSLLAHSLARLGLAAAMAVNGREALALLEREPFDLLLLDIHMPELDGFQVVAAIRERERTAGGHLPVIALT